MLGLGLRHGVLVLGAQDRGQGVENCKAAW